MHSESRSDNYVVSIRTSGFLSRWFVSHLVIFFSHTKSAPANNHQPANNIFLSQQISTSHSQPNRVLGLQSQLLSPDHHQSIRQYQYGIAIYRAGYDWQNHRLKKLVGPQNWFQPNNILVIACSKHICYACSYICACVL